MQTQTQQASKKNKVTVPFYSPPSRLYGQTPADIIKEARAAVMNPPAIGIKPVFTNRPFTPKEKERTLFGNVKKRTSRPPSTFSLRNLQSQELGSRVKLPSIDIVSRRKTHATFRYTNNLSLDNLTEDYDAETIEEIGESDNENLPTCRKSHSCPKEGRMVKTSSFNEIEYQNFESVTKTHDELKKIETIKATEYVKFNSCVQQENEKISKNVQGNNQDSNVRTPTIFGDPVKNEHFDAETKEIHLNSISNQSDKPKKNHVKAEKFEAEVIGRNDLQEPKKVESQLNTITKVTDEHKENTNMKLEEQKNKFDVELNGIQKKADTESNKHHKKFFKISDEYEGKDEPESNESLKNNDLKSDENKVSIEKENDKNVDVKNPNKQENKKLDLDKPKKEENEILGMENSKKEESKNSEEEQPKKETFKVSEKRKSQEIIEQSKQTNEKGIEEELKEKKIISKKPIIQKSEEVVESNKNESRNEKYVLTGHKSEYLKAYNEGYKTPQPIKKIETVPQEILDLYETARYYGVDVESPVYASISNTPKKTTKDSSVKSIEDFFGEKSNIEIYNNSKGSLSNVEEQKKVVDETTENVIDKSVASNTSIMSITLNSDSSRDDVQYVMNNKKRYHVVNEKGDSGKEKAYKRWNNKQEANNFIPQEKSSGEGWDLFWKNSYFRNTHSETEEDNKNLQRKSDQDFLNRLITRMVGLSKIGADNRDVYETTTQLYNLLKKNELILDTKVKGSILKVLYLYADKEDPELLLSLAKLLLLLKVDSSLSVACKLIFKVARLDSNDHLFLNEEDVLELFLEGIGRASPLDFAESCIYGYGALKFLTMNYNILSRILHLGGLDLMTLHLKMINSAYLEKGKVGEQTQHALFQLTGALRHVAAGEGALPLFLTTNCIPTVCKTLQLFHKDEDIVTNISRTLSLLSADESVTQVLMSVENILGIVIDLIERYKMNDKILIRLSYCLGNIVEHSDLARVQLSRNETSLTILLNLLKFYIDKDLEISMKEINVQNPDELNSGTVDDIIVKVIRIIANMSMNPIVGSNLSPASNEKKSLQLSKLLAVLLMRKDPGITLLATLGCLNNISYYCNTHSVLIDITQGVERVLGLPSVECQAEAARVLGNLTRHKEIRDLIYNTGGVNQLTKLLSSQDQEVVRCACGALVNMMLDSSTRQRFVEDQGIDRLVNALEQFYGDWSLASLAARAIWNSCADDVSSAMLHNNVENLLNILAHSLEEENWNDGDVAWEEFASIATDLLEKINSHLEST